MFVRTIAIWARGLWCPPEGRLSNADKRVPRPSTCASMLLKTRIRQYRELSSRSAAYAAPDTVWRFVPQCRGLYCLGFSCHAWEHQSKTGLKLGHRSGGAPPGPSCGPWKLVREFPSPSLSTVYRCRNRWMLQQAGSSTTDSPASLQPTR